MHPTSSAMLRSQFHVVMGRIIVAWRRGRKLTLLNPPRSGALMKPQDFMPGKLDREILDELTRVDAAIVILAAQTQRDRNTSIPFPESQSRVQK
jgi:hypothetical protein